MTQDRRAFWARQFADHRAALNRYFRRRLGYFDDTEDLGQEVFLRLIRLESDAVDKIRSLEAYLYTVAANLLRERALLRRRRGGDLPLDDVDPVFLIAPDLTGEDVLHKSDRELRLSKIIDGLPPKLKAVIIMHFHHDMTYQQIADKTGVTVHAVKKSISRALHACRSKVKKNS